MILYHFTALHHHESIYRDGYLRTTESNIGSPVALLPPHGEHYGPDVVWLTDQPDPTPVDIAVDGALLDKMQVRFAVRLEDAERWSDFAEHHGIHPEWRRILEDGRRPETWWVVTRPVRLTEVTAIAVTIGGKQ